MLSTATCAPQVSEKDLDQELIKPLADYYLSTGTSIQSTAWNKQREAILADALRLRLLPAFALELRTRMAADARHNALHGVANRLWDHASRRPLQVPIHSQYHCNLVPLLKASRRGLSKQTPNSRGSLQLLFQWHVVL